MSGYAKPGCCADTIVHGCAGPACQIGWREAERTLDPVTVDLRPYKQTIIAAGLGLAANLYLGGQDRMSQDQDNVHLVVEDCIVGKAAEAGFAVAYGIHPEDVLTDERSSADFTVRGMRIDVKYAKRLHGAGDLLRFSLNKGSWDRIKHDHTYRLVAVSVDHWTATVHGVASTSVIREALLQGQIPCHAGTGRAGGSPWYDVRVGLLEPLGVL